MVWYGIILIDIMNKCNMKKHINVQWLCIYFKALHIEYTSRVFASIKPHKRNKIDKR